MQRSKLTNTASFPVITDPLAARRVARSVDFNVVDLPGYYRNMARLAGLDLSALIRIVDSIPFFAHGQRHLLLRRVIADVFKENRIAAWQHVIDEEVDAAIARIGASQSADLAKDFADPLFSNAMTRLFGLPPERADDLNRWAEGVRFVSELLLPVRRVRRMNDAAGHFLETIHAGRDRLAGLHDTSLSRQIARAAGKDMTTVEIDALVAALFIAGQTTAHTLANILLIVLRLDPARRSLPEDAPARRNAVEDLIRRGGAPQYLLRIAQQPQIVSGHELANGDPVLVHIPSANGLPDTAGTDAGPGSGCPFGRDTTRNSHFSFGAGIHHCPGAPLARMMIDTALDRLLTTFPDIELLETEPEHFGTDIIRSPKALPCRLYATAPSRAPT